MRFDLSDEEWSVLESLMPKSRKSARPHDRRIINAIFYVLRTGIPWRDLPERYGPYTSAYNRFNRWSRRGVWKRPARSWPCGAASLSRAIYDAGCSFRTFATASGPRRSSFGYEAKRRGMGPG